MAYTTQNIGLSVWNLLGDGFDHAQLAGNWVKLDAHDHGANGGAQIQTQGLANGAVTGAKVANPISLDTVTISDFTATTSDVTTETVGTLDATTISTTGLTASSAAISNLTGTTTASNITASSIAVTNIKATTAAATTYSGQTVTAYEGDFGNMNWGTASMTAAGTISGTTVKAVQSSAITHHCVDSSNSPVIPSSIQVTLRVDNPTAKEITGGAGLAWGVDHFTNAPTTTTFHIYVIANTYIDGLTFHLDWLALS